MPISQDKSNRGIYTLSGDIPSECVEHYQKEGWILLKGFFDYEKEIVAIHKEMNRLIQYKMKSLNLEETLDLSSDTIDNDCFLSVCRQDREKAGEIYRASRHLPSLHQLLVNEKCLTLAKTLMDTESVNTIPYVPLRIDIRGEEKYLFDWHQDYPYTQGSMDGIVLWMSLFDLEEGEGGVELIPGSHLQGLRRVVYLDPENRNKNGGKTIAMENLESLDTSGAIHFPISAGDVLVFSTLLIHKSIPMDKGSVRWTTQIRYANFANEDAIQRGWPGGMIEGSDLRKDHPEYVVSETT